MALKSLVSACSHNVCLEEKHRHVAYEPSASLQDILLLRYRHDLLPFFISLKYNDTSYHVLKQNKKKVKIGTFFYIIFIINLTGASFHNHFQD